MDRQTIGFVSYGADGGTRSVEQWRQIVANFQMLDVRAGVREAQMSRSRR